MFDLVNLKPPANLYKGRSEKQPLRWRCINPDCAKENGGVQFEFSGDRDRCPRCGAQNYPYVLMLALIHFMLPDEKGEILSMGRRYRLACDRRRYHLATKTNNEAATGEPGAVTCPGCKAEMEKLKGIVAPSGQVLVRGKG